MTIKLLQGKKMVTAKFVKFGKDESVYDGAPQKIVVDFYSKVVGKHSPLGFMERKRKFCGCLVRLRPGLLGYEKDPASYT